MFKNSSFSFITFSKPRGIGVNYYCYHSLNIICVGYIRTRSSTMKQVYNKNLISALECEADSVEVRWRVSGVILRR